MDDTRSRRNLTIAGLCVLVLLIQMVLSVYVARHYRGSWDMRDFMNWMHDLRKFGFFGAYRYTTPHTNLLNYPPVYPLVMYVYQKFVTIQGASIFNLHQSFLTKFPILVLNWAALTILMVTLRERGTWRYLIVFIGVVFNPALFVAGPMWGQIDIPMCVLMILSLVWMQRHPAWAGTVFALAMLYKPQAITVIPTLFVLWLGFVRASEWSKMWKYLAGVVWPFVLVAGVFAAKGTLLDLLRRTYLHTVGMFTWVSLHAFNIWYYVVGVTPKTNDATTALFGLSYRDIGILMLAIVTLLVLIFQWRAHTLQPEVALVSGFIVNFSFFMLTTEMHERYILPAMLMVCVLVLYNRAWLPIAIGLTVTTTLNLLAVLYFPLLLHYGELLAWVNLVLLAGSFVIAFRSFTALRQAWRQSSF